MPRRDSCGAVYYKVTAPGSSRLHGKYFGHVYCTGKASGSSSYGSNSIRSHRHRQHHQVSTADSYASITRNEDFERGKYHENQEAAYHERSSQLCSLCRKPIHGVALSHNLAPKKPLCLRCYEKHGKGSIEDCHSFIALRQNQVCPDGMIAMKIDGKFYPIPRAYITELVRFRNAPAGAHVAIKLPLTCEQACIPALKKYLLNFFWFRRCDVPILPSQKQSTIPEIRAVDRDPRAAFFRMTLFLWQIGSREKIPELQREAERMLRLKQSMREDPVALLEQVFDLDPGRGGHGLRVWARSFMSKRHNATLLNSGEWQARWLGFIRKNPLQVAIAMSE